MVEHTIKSSSTYPQVANTEAPEHKAGRIEAAYQYQLNAYQSFNQTLGSLA